MGTPSYVGTIFASLSFKLNLQERCKPRGTLAGVLGEYVLYSVKDVSPHNVLRSAHLTLYICEKRTGEKNVCVFMRHAFDKPSNLVEIVLMHIAKKIFRVNSDSGGTIFRIDCDISKNATDEGERISNDIKRYLEAVGGIEDIVSEVTDAVEYVLSTHLPTSCITS